MNLNLIPLYNKKNILEDIQIESPSKKLLLLGNNGKEREINSLNSYKDNSLALFLGLGFGYAVEEFLEKTKASQEPLCIIDKEDFSSIAEYSALYKVFLENPRITIISTDDKNEALKLLLEWQAKHGKKEFSFIKNSLYFRLDREYYSAIEKHLTILHEGRFWENVNIQPFKNTNLKVLFAEQSWLTSELIHACQRLGIEYKALDLQKLTKDSVEAYAQLLFDTAVNYKPDMIITFNHLGVDSEGILMDLLEKLKLPLASIFVDHPYLILHDTYCKHAEWLSIFTYDEDNIETLRKYGYKYIDYLPLGTDIERFNPRNKTYDVPREWGSEVSFVGTSMRTLVASRLNEANLPKILRHAYKDIAKEFGTSPLHIVKECIRESFPELYPLFLSLPARDQLLYERVITWEATRQYRNSCIEQILPFSPVIMGEKQWKNALRGMKGDYRLVQSVTYFTDLPKFYPQSTINFNTTSKQMKNAVNQRVFDVPACGAFLITDWRAQMDNLLESGKEIISYKEVDEIPELISYYLKNDTAREKIVEAGRKRIIAEHSWDSRFLKLIDIMRKRYS